MNLARIRLITFDVTNTLLKFRAEPGREYGEIGAMYGVLCDTDALATSFKGHHAKMTREHPNFGLRTGLGWERWWRLVVSGTFKDAKSFDIDDRKLTSLADHLIDLYRTSACWQHCYGAVDLLAYLATKPIVLGCISNFDPRLETILVNTMLRPHFRFALSSYEVGHEKPDARIFERAISESGLDGLKPNECVHVGNSVRNDYDGAVGAGWQAILIKDEPPRKRIVERHPHVKEDAIYRSLYEFHRALLAKNEPQKNFFRNDASSDFQSSPSLW